MRALVAGARVARLATVSADGAPHIVPFVFVLAGETVFTSVDTKPKTGRELRRVANLRRDPRAAVLIDHYTEDWPELWWVRLDVTARILADGDPDASGGRAALLARYDQYDDELRTDTIIALDIVRWSGWSWR